MRTLVTRLLRERRSATAVIFAVVLVPLVMMVGLAIDFSFYIQARSQAAMAADAAATHAVRAADAIYTTETAANQKVPGTYPNPVQDATTDGGKIGLGWFNAALGAMDRATISGTPIVSVTQNPAAGAAGFSASVSFAGSYPTFFGALFKKTTPWNINGAAGAESAYNYVEILMLLDNSSSMLIADSSSVVQMEELTVCPTGGINAQFDGNSWNSAFYQHAPADAGGNAPVEVPETSTSIAHYTPVSAQTNIGNVLSGTGIGYAENPTGCAAGYTGAGAAPYAPCAFACHMTSASTNPLMLPTFSAKTGAVTGYQAVAGYSDDYYGLAKYNNITLRLDDLQTAASNVITAMEENQQAAGQFSIGVYEFNNDVIPVWPAAADGVQPSEASTDLADAATAIANAPAPIEGNASIGNTDFADSIVDFINGTYLGGTAYRASASGTSSPKLTAGASTSATTPTTPQKDVFIVTDGMEDTSVSGTREEGEMTGYLAETGTATAITPALCNQLKSLHMTVYVLYIDYNPISNQFYYNSSYKTTPNYNIKATPYGAQDYPALNPVASNEYAEPTTASAGEPLNSNSNLAGKSPDVAGLIGCATSPTDFFEATKDSDINTALNAMLQSALTSSIQLTQ